MKALSIRQPWAWAIMEGHKRVENRTWNTTYRGRLLVHAGRQPDRDPRTAQLFAELGIGLPADMARGVIIGSVELVDVVPVASVANDPWAFGPWCWVLRDPQPFREPPLVYKGRLSLFEVPDETLAAYHSLGLL